MKDRGKTESRKKEYTLRKNDEDGQNRRKRRMKRMTKMRRMKEIRRMRITRRIKKGCRHGTHERDEKYIEG
jgi:hypothetical protein